MNPSPASVVGILSRLSIGVSRTSVRHSSTRRRPKPKDQKKSNFKPGHGQKIYVFNHIQDGIVIYSHKPKLEREEAYALNQIPFTVKKQKPAVIRRDYWQAMCMIQFPEGMDEIGRQVFHKLRECRAAHELNWSWQAKELQKMSRIERGKAILNQKANSVADIAAVLGGFGRGNTMWLTETVETTQPETMAIEAAAAEEQPTAAPTNDVTNESAKADASTVQTAPKSKHGKDNKKTPKTTKKGGEVEVRKTLRPVSIYWANDVDMHWARKWTSNVEHFVGLPENHRVWQWQTREIMMTPPEADSEVEDVETISGNEIDANETEPDSPLETVEEKPEVAEVAEDKPKKSWFGWLGGKSGDSSTDKRA